MADYWLKLYTEILNDPKMATLPDRVWRRTVECFLAAKEVNHDGHLPDTTQLAWLLRMNPADLELDLQQVAYTGIIQKEVNGWFIPNFSKRQAAASDRDRKQQQRDRDRSQQYYGGITPKSRDVTQSREEQKQNREEAEQSRGREETRAMRDVPPAPPTPSDDPTNWSPLQAQQNPQIKAFVQATGRLPGRPTYKTIITTIKEHGFTADYLEPFWEAWNLKGYNPANVAWLTEWAVAGAIPADQPHPKRSNGKAGSGNPFDAILAESEVAGGHTN